MTRGRGSLRKTIGETTKKYLDFNSSSVDMVYDRTLWH